MISDDHEGLKAAVTRIPGATAFAQEDAQSASAPWRQVATLKDTAEHDILASMNFPKSNRSEAGGSRYAGGPFLRPSRVG